MASITLLGIDLAKDVGSCRETGEMRSGSTRRRTRAHALMSGLCRRKRRCATRRYLPKCHRFTYLPT